MTYTHIDIINALIFLLPGVIATAAFYSITAYKKPNAFGQIFHALTFTAIGQLIATLIQTAFHDPNPESAWIPTLTFALPTASAILAAIIFAIFFNHDLMHKVLRLMGVTHETAYPAWYSTFANNKDCYVVLHLKDQRRLLGWPQYWPSEPEVGHFKIIKAQWLTHAQDITEAHKNHIIYAILIAVDDISFIEFIQTSELDPTDQGDNVNA